MWIVCLRALTGSHSFVPCFVSHCFSHSSLRSLRSHHSAHHFLHRHLYWILQWVERRSASRFHPWPIDLAEPSHIKRDQNMLISQKERSRDRTAAAFSSKGSDEKRKILSIWMSQGPCSKGGKWTFEHDTAKKGKGKGTRSRSPVKRHSSADKIPRRQGEVHPEKKLVLRVSTTKEEIAVMFGRVIIGIHRIANTSGKRSVTWERSVHLFTRKRRKGLPVVQRLVRAKFRDKFPSLNIIQNSSENARHCNAPPYDQKVYRVESVARRVCKVYSTQTSQRALQDKRTQQWCPLSDTLKRKDVHSRQWRFVTHDQIIFLEKFQGKKTIRQSSTNLDILIASGVVVSDTQAKVYIKELGAYLWVHLVENLPSMLSMGRLCNEVGYSCSWPSGETPRLSKGKKVIECGIENNVFVVAVIKQNAVPSIEFSSASGNFERWKEVEDTMMDLLKPFYRRITRTLCIFLDSKSWKWP